MMARHRGWGWIRIRTTRENNASAQDRRIRLHPKCNLPFHAFPLPRRPDVMRDIPAVSRTSGLPGVAIHAIMARIISRRQDGIDPLSV
jgi:hypothetical protein